MLYVCTSNALPKTAFPNMKENISNPKSDIKQKCLDETIEITTLMDACGIKRDTVSKMIGMNANTFNLKCLPAYSNWFKPSEIIKIKEALEEISKKLIKFSINTTN